MSTTLATVEALRLTFSHLGEHVLDLGNPGKKIITGVKVVMVILGASLEKLVGKIGPLSWSSRDIGVLHVVIPVVTVHGNFGTTCRWPLGVRAPFMEEAKFQDVLIVDHIPPRGFANDTVNLKVSGEPLGHADRKEIARRGAVIESNVLVEQ